MSKIRKGHRCQRPDSPRQGDRMSCYCGRHWVAQQLRAQIVWVLLDRGDRLGVRDGDPS